MSLIKQCNPAVVSYRWLLACAIIAAFLAAMFWVPFLLNRLSRVPYLLNDNRLVFALKDHTLRSTPCT